MGDKTTGRKTVKQIDVLHHTSDEDLTVPVTAKPLKSM